MTDIPDILILCFPVAENIFSATEIETYYAKVKEIGEKTITVEGISEELYTAPFGEPDLIIRTGGEMRLSNFMLYQGAYSELYFTDVRWPDMTEKDVDLAIETFMNRKRRFGGI